MPHDLRPLSLVALLLIADVVIAPLKLSANFGGSSFPSDYRGDEDNISPPISWKGVPKKTQSFVLIFDSTRGGDGAALAQGHDEYIVGARLLIGEQGGRRAAPRREARGLPSQSKSSSFVDGVALRRSMYHVHDTNLRTQAQAIAQAER